MPAAAHPAYSSSCPAYPRPLDESCLLYTSEYFGRKASEAVPSWYAVGKVLAASLLKIRADGLDLDLEDLFIAQHLTAGWQEQLTGLSWPLTAVLPQKTFQGTCNADFLPIRVK